MDIIKVKKVSYEDVDLSTFRDKVKIEFRSRPSDSYYGFVKMEINTDIGPVTFNATVFKSKKDGKPRLFWYTCQEGLSTRVRESNGFTHAQETAFSPESASIIDGLITDHLEKQGVKWSLPVAKKKVEPAKKDGKPSKAEEDGTTPYDP